MNKYCLDTSAWLSYIKGELIENKLEKIIDNENIFTPMLVLAEISDVLIREKKNPEDIIQFIKNKSQILPLTINITLESSKIKNKQKRINPKFGLFDSLHFATAQTNNLIFVTKDKDFSNLPNTLILDKIE